MRPGPSPDSMNTYHEPEHKAGFTDEEFAKHGEFVLMTWREWVNLREKLRENLQEHPAGTEPLPFYRGYRAALSEIMLMMDETLA